MEQIKKLREQLDTIAQETAKKEAEIAKLNEQTANTKKEISAYAEQMMNEIKKLTEGTQDEKTKEKENKKEKRRSCIKNIAIGAAVTTLLVGGYHIVKHNTHILKGNNTKLPSLTSVNTNKKWSNEYFEALVTQFMIENPNMDKEAAKKYLAVYYQDELMKHNPDLLYELTGIYEYQTLTDELFNELVNKTYRDLKKMGLEVTFEDVTKFVTIINIDQLAQDNPELLTSIVGNQNAGEIITDAFKVTSAIKDTNYHTYEQTKSTTKLIRVSDFIFDKKAQADLKLIEAYADKASAVRGDKEKQNAIISELLTEIYRSTGTLSNMEDGIGFASTVAIGGIINNISFNDNGVRIISKENYDLLMSHDTLELYLSNIYGNINKCAGKTLKK